VLDGVDEGSVKVSMEKRIMRDLKSDELCGISKNSLEMESLTAKFFCGTPRISNDSA
jgi:hypothetical protein